jgi:phage-related protein
MRVIVEQLVEWRLAGETEVLGENLPQRHLSTTNPTWPDPGSNPGHGGKPATNRLSYGAAVPYSN